MDSGEEYSELPEGDSFPVVSPEDRESVSGTIDIPNQEFTDATVSPDLRGRISLRVSEALEHELRDIAEDPSYPLNSPSEVIRFCLNAGVYRLRNWKPRPTLLAAMRKTNALLSRDRIQAQSTEMMELLDGRVYWYIAAGEYDEAVSLIIELKSYFSGIQDDFWKDYNIKLIDEKMLEWESAIHDAREASEKAGDI